jgi:transmembrane sensor
MQRFTVIIQANSPHSPDLPEAVRAEAAVWLARLHSEQRTASTERAFRAWFTADPMHAAAFERITNTWEAARGVSQAVDSWQAETASRAQATRIRRKTVAAALALIVLVVTGSWILQSALRFSKAQVVETSLGERRSLVLPDGTRLVLNTDSRVTLRFDEAARRLTLNKGQAHFNVATAPARPFIVEAGGRQIVATGTVFDVRWTNAKLSVVLFEGHVSVSPVSGARENPDAGIVILEPGQRAQFENTGTIVRSVKRLDREDAWIGGRAVFDNTRLGDAVAEMNRYTRKRIEISDSSVAEWRISGTFSTDDVDAFARSLVDLLPVSIELRDDRTVLRQTND